MAATIVLSIDVNATGRYADTDMSLTANSAAEVTMTIEGLSMTFAPERPVWDTADPMGYTITIDNQTTLPVEAPVAIVTDAYPAGLCTVDVNSVKLNGGTTGFTADVTAGVLTVTLSDDIAGSTEAVITFLVNKGVTP